MVYRFEDIVEKNVDDLMSVCGNTPGIDRNPHFRKAGLPGGSGCWR